MSKWIRAWYISKDNTDLCKDVSIGFKKVQTCQ